MRKHQFYHFIRATLHSEAYIMEAREKTKILFLASDRATLHSEAYIMEAREKSKNIGFHFSTERDYIAKRI